MIQLINRQRRRKLNPKAWHEFSETALRAIHSNESSVTIVFVSDAAIKKLNQQFRGKNDAADVLSFPTKAEDFETNARRRRRKRMA